jgi:hypothetical protein
MAKVAQKVLGFNLEATQEALTAHAGLGLFGEFLHGLKWPQWLTKCMPMSNVNYFGRSCCLITKCYRAASPRMLPNAGLEFNVKRRLWRFRDRA